MTNSKTFFSRAFDALVESRMRSAEREVARYHYLTDSEAADPFSHKK